MKMNTHVDVRRADLVMHRTEDRDANIDEGRYISAHIPGARFVESPRG